MVENYQLNILKSPCGETTFDEVNLGALKENTNIRL